jgi:hypothetical protein
MEEFFREQFFHLYRYEPVSTSFEFPKVQSIFQKCTDFNATVAGALLLGVSSDFASDRVEIPTL